MSLAVLNLSVRKRFSKKAKEIAEEIANQIKKVNDFGNDISFRRIVQLSFKQEDFQNFDSRTSALSRTMKALQNSEVRMIGLCGMGGMGKTMLVKQVTRLAMEGNMFSKAIMTVVSQNPNIEHIQQEIAEQLGLTLDEKVLSTRANRLAKRLKQEKNILIVIDDVWEVLDLSKVGIYFENDNKERKIILTSRS